MDEEKKTEGVQAPETATKQVEVEVSEPAETTEAVTYGDVEDTATDSGMAQETIEMPRVDDATAGNIPEVQAGHEFGFHQIPGGYNGTSDQGIGGGSANTMTEDVIGFMQGPYAG